MVLGGVAFRRELGLEEVTRRGPQVGVSALTEETPESMRALSPCLSISLSPSPYLSLSLFQSPSLSPLSICQLPLYLSLPISLNLPLSLCLSVSLPAPCAAT